MADSTIKTSTSYSSSDRAGIIRVYGEALTVTGVW